jgi:hypothetical protein
MGNIDRLQIGFHACSWLCAGGVLCAGLVAGIFGEANDTTGRESWCWIKDERKYFVWKLGLYYGPFACVWLLCAALYFVVHRRIQTLVISESLKGRAEQRIRLYLLVFFLCIGVGVANRIQNEVTQQPLFWFAAPPGSSDPLLSLLCSSGRAAAPLSLRPAG